jgi:UDP-3-O-[3-hydroxymyristoyl] glucosamine N-acyltransferase
MRSLHGRFIGPLFVSEDTSFHGLIDGDASVGEDVTFLHHGMIAGNLSIASGARVELMGMVAGSVTNRGDLIVYGNVRGGIRNVEGGRATLKGRSQERQRVRG